MVAYAHREPPSLAFQYAAGEIEALTSWVHAISHDEYWGDYGGYPQSMTIEETETGGFRITMTWPDPISDLVRTVEGVPGDWLIWLRRWYSTETEAAYTGTFIRRSAGDFPGVEFEPIN